MTATRSDCAARPSRSILMLHLAVVAMLPMWGVGCTNAILFSSSTLSGVEFNAAEGGEQAARIGYRRIEGVIMPVAKENKGTKNPELMDEAFSVLSISKFESGSLFTKAFTTGRVTQVFATGRAAVNPGAPRAVAKTFGALEGISEGASVESLLSLAPMRQAFVELAATHAAKFDAAAAAVFPAGSNPSFTTFSELLDHASTNDLTKAQLQALRSQLVADDAIRQAIEKHEQEGDGSD